MDWRDIIKRLPDGVLVVNATGVIRFANAGACTLLGYDAGELDGADLEALLPGGLSEPETAPRQRPVVWGTCKDGRIIPVTVTAAAEPLDADGSTVALVRRAAATTTPEAQARLASAAVEAAANGILITDVRGRIVHVNEAFSSLTGYTAAEVAGKTPRILKSGDTEDGIYGQLWETILSGEVWSGDMVNRRKDGTRYTEEQTITPVRDDAGKISHFIAIKQDVTERRRRKRALERRVEELTLLHDLALLSVSVVSPDQLASRAAAIVAKRLALPRFSVELANDAGKPVEIAASAPPVQGVRVVRPMQVEGESFGQVVAVFASPEDAEEPEILLVDTVARQLALALKTAQLVGELDKLAHSDDLTGLANRRRFFDLAKVEVERSQRYDRTMTLVLLDIDRFKSINDTHGHAHGDQVLRRLGLVLQDTCRLCDIVARLGGDEFVAMLPETSADGAVRMVERVRHELSAAQEKGLPSCTISAGISEFGLDHDDLDPLLKAADEALYEAKHGGRNRLAVRRSRRGSKKDFVAMRRSTMPPDG